jgi:nucleotide-binding universal stress UspA family protein
MHAIDTLTPAVVGAISYAVDDMEAVRQENKKAGEELVARAASSMVKAKPKVETVLREGTPEIEIVEEAKQWGADLIVIGSHGHTGFKRLVLGSVAHSVVAHAPCSVEVVRRKEW